MARVLPIITAAKPAIAEPKPVAVRKPLGSTLVQQGLIEESVLQDALEQQRTQDQKLGQILVNNHCITDEQLQSALSSQSGLGRVDLNDSPIDASLMDGIDPYACLAIGAVPWRRVGSTLVIAVSSPDDSAAARKLFSQIEAKRVSFTLTSVEQIRVAISNACRGRMDAEANIRTPEGYSCRSWTQSINRGKWIAAVAVIFTFTSFSPLLALQILMFWILAMNALTMCLRLTALFVRVKGKNKTESHGGLKLMDYRKLPRVSLLIPLNDECAVVPKLVNAMKSLNYPPALLDIKLVLEEDDLKTLMAIDAVGLPPNFDIITVPGNGLRTKPRAMNYALPFCEGEIVGIYDAEDRPDPDQIQKVVEHLQASPPEVVCVQGYLDFFNTNRNVISRCFTIEYAIWFRIVLLGVQKLGIPIPLGGTTVFFRRNVLEEIGAWDAHNVTEDADLGMRLARFGYRCDMIPSTTMEEANHRPVAWIKQRSRWLKGYVITWVTHMRRPIALARDLGFRGFMGFQILFLGAITSYLAIPLFWALWLAMLGYDFDLLAGIPHWLAFGMISSMMAGQVIMLFTAFVAALDSGRNTLAFWSPVMSLYWLLGAVAAYRAVFEVFVKPSYWAKTEHGIDDTR
ncbi:glycosyltransferase family 2 protein [Amaricoccus tamworthensis]|uniref:glycosyltransferase family 2 protein n=1 Tax=Amaricoccus tamworthensis TaxID=57002 RepID=UPI003C7ADAE7